MWITEAGQPVLDIDVTVTVDRIALEELRERILTNYENATDLLGPDDPTTKDAYNLFTQIDDLFDRLSL